MKILQSEMTGTQTSFSTKFGRKLNFILSCLSFLWSASTAATYIYFQCSYLDNYYNYSRTLCIKYAEFQHFILRFNKISLLSGYHHHRKRGQGGENRPKDMVTLRITLLSVFNFQISHIFQIIYFFIFIFIYIFIFFYFLKKLNHCATVDH